MRVSLWGARCAHLAHARTQRAEPAISRKPVVAVKRERDLQDRSQPQRRVPPGLAPVSELIQLLLNRCLKCNHRLRPSSRPKPQRSRTIGRWERTHATHFERVFGTPHNVDLSALCGAIGTPYTLVQTADDYEILWGDAVLTDPDPR